MRTLAKKLKQLTSTAGTYRVAYDEHGRPNTVDIPADSKADARNLFAAMQDMDSGYGDLICVNKLA